MTREDALKIDLTDVLKRCAAMESGRDQSSEAFQRQWDMREANLKRERKRLQERAEQLSGDVIKLTECLKKERAESEASVKEVCSAPTMEEPWGGGGVTRFEVGHGFVL